MVINGNKKRKLTNDKEDFHFDTADHSENGNAGVFKNVDGDSYTVNNEITDWGKYFVTYYLICQKNLPKSKCLKPSLIVIKWKS